MEAAAALTTSFLETRTRTAGVNHSHFVDSSYPSIWSEVYIVPIPWWGLYNSK